MRICYVFSASNTLFLFIQPHVSQSSLAIGGDCKETNYLSPPSDREERSNVEKEYATSIEVEGDGERLHTPVQESEEDPLTHV